MGYKNIGIFLLGPQGSGKGTQANKLSQFFSLNKGLGSVHHIEMSSLVRSAVRGDQTLGEQATSLMTRGQKLPDRIILEIFEKRIQLRLEEYRNGTSLFIFDGCARTDFQASEIKKFLEKHNFDIIVVKLELPRKECVERIAKRVGAEKRPDDSDSQAVKDRLDGYFSCIEDILAVFCDYVTVCAKPNEDLVFVEILKQLALNSVSLFGNKKA